MLVVFIEPLAHIPKSTLFVYDKQLYWFSHHIHVYACFQYEKKMCRQAARYRLSVKPPKKCSSHIVTLVTLTWYKFLEICAQ